MSNISEIRTQITIDSIGDFLTKIAEKSQNVYWLSSPDFNRIVYISPAFEEIWGRPRELLYSHPENWIEYLHPDDLHDYHPIYEMATRIKKDGIHARYDETYRIIRPDGSIRHITDHGFPIYIDGKCYGVTGVAVDISREKQLEEETKKAKKQREIAEKTRIDFIRNIEHDIRTPFSGIYGMSKILAEQETDTEKKEALYDIMNSAKELLDYCNQIVDFSKIELSEYPLTNELFNLNNLFQKIFSIMHPAASVKNLNFILDRDPNMPENYIGDHNRLFRILSNLTSNAIKFTNSGQIKLSAHLLQLKKNGYAEIKICVEDTGTGIPHDKKEYVFEKFSKLTPSSSNLYKGIGLGLRAVKKYVDDMHGKIELESQMGIGTRFDCTFEFQLP